MFLYALSFLTSEEEAEDVIQEVFVNFWKDNTFQKVKGEVTKIYLFRSVKNNCLNRLKKKDVLRDRLDLLYEDVAEEEMMTWNDELIQEVETEITNMPEQTREIIRGVFFQDLKYQEVADQLGISINTGKQDSGGTFHGGTFPGGYAVSKIFSILTASGGKVKAPMTGQTL